MRPRPFDDPWLTVHAGVPLDHPDLETALRRLTPTEWDTALRGMKVHLDRRQDRRQRIRHVRARDGSTHLVWEVGAEAGPTARALLAVACRARGVNQGIHPTIVMARVDPVMKLMHRNHGAVTVPDTADTAVPAANPLRDDGTARSPEALVRIIGNLEARLARESVDAPCPHHAIVRYKRRTEDGVRIRHFYVQSRYAPEAPLLEAWLASYRKGAKGITDFHPGRLREALRALPVEATVTSIFGRTRGRPPGGGAG